MRFRCSAAAADEPMAGTAAHDRAFLLIEHPRPWGRDAVAMSIWLPDDVKAALGQADVRVQLIARHGRTGPDTGFRVFLVHAAPEDPWVETTRLETPADLLELDLAALAAGRRTGLASYDDPLLLVCTHARRDACCAEFGRPLAAALAARHADQTWETSHVGGHRFAGAMLVLPAGLSYGRVDAESGLRIAALAAEGRVDVERLRGRAAYPPAVQAAEVVLRGRLGLDGLGEVRLVAHAGEDVVLAAGGEHHALRVEAIVGEPQRQSCADLVAKPTTSWRVTDSASR